MLKSRFSFDEREKNLLRSICTVLYAITLFALIGIQLYRQFVLHQPRQDWNDIAILISVNAIILLGSGLYLSGAINPKRIKLHYLIAGYAGFVLFGLAFTIFKYAVLLEQAITMRQVGEYFLIVLGISGVLVLMWGILAYLGSRRIDKQIE
jgi:hypothetical protein